VRLERGRDGEAGGGIAVEDVDELLLLEGGDAECVALGIDGEELAGHEAAAAGLAEGLLVDLVEAVAVGGVPEAAEVGADDEVVLGGPREAELGERADGAEDVDGEERAEASHLRVWAEEVERAAAGDGDLLRGGPGGVRLLGVATAEAADDGAHGAGREWHISNPHD
jgi:hypothetical protein